MEENNWKGKRKRDRKITGSGVTKMVFVCGAGKALVDVNHCKPTLPGLPAAAGQAAGRQGLKTVVCHAATRSLTTNALTVFATLQGGIGRIGRSLPDKRERPSVCRRAPVFGRRDEYIFERGLNDLAGLSQCIDRRLLMTTQETSLVWVCACQRRSGSKVLVNVE